MIDLETKENVHLSKTNCFWCRNSFESTPLGCPICIVPGKRTKKYTSIVNKTEYSIEESTLDNERDTEPYYQSDGSFCSFNCCASFIDSEKKNPLYLNSYTLLLNIYNAMFSKNLSYIPRAPHFRMLKEYGGTLTIKEFRHSFNNADFIYQGTVRDPIKFLSIGHLYEKKIKF